MENDKQAAATAELAGMVRKELELKAADTDSVRRWEARLQSDEQISALVAGLFSLARSIGSDATKKMVSAMAAGVVIPKDAEAKHWVQIDPAAYPRTPDEREAALKELEREAEQLKTVRTPAATESQAMSLRALLRGTADPFARAEVAELLAELEARIVSATEPPPAGESA